MSKFEFFNHSDGSRVRVPAGKIGPPSLVRTLYRAHVREINDTHALRAALRAGKYTSLGSYPVFYIVSDGESLCVNCVRENYRVISSAVRERSRDGWRVIACDVNYEDITMTCAHCGQLIESAYGEG